MPVPIHEVSLRTEQDRQEYIEYIKALVIDEKNHHDVTCRKAKRRRTTLQNSALHKYLGMLSAELNKAGWSFWAVMNRKAQAKIDYIRGHVYENYDYAFGAHWAANEIEKSLPKGEVDWTLELVKEYLWRPIQVSQIDIESTAEADTGDYTVVYENLNRLTGNLFGVSLQFPSKEAMA